jgi:Zn-finger protein
MLQTIALNCVDLEKENCAVCITPQLICLTMDLTVLDRAFQQWEVAVCFGVLWIRKSTPTHWITSNSVKIETFAMPTEIMPYNGISVCRVV